MDTYIFISHPMAQLFLEKPAVRLFQMATSSRTGLDGTGGEVQIAVVESRLVIVLVILVKGKSYSRATAIIQ